jgi:hypothetical protein
MLHDIRSTFKSRKCISQLAQTDSSIFPDWQGHLLWLADSERRQLHSYAFCNEMRACGIFMSLCLASIMTFKPNDEFSCHFVICIVYLIRCHLPEYKAWNYNPWWTGKVKLNVAGVCISRNCGQESMLPLSFAVALPRGKGNAAAHWFVAAQVEIFNFRYNYPYYAYYKKRLKCRAVVRSCKNFLLIAVAGPRSCKNKLEGRLTGMCLSVDNKR